VTTSLTEQMICALRLSEYFDHLGIGYPLDSLGIRYKMTSFHPYCDYTNWTDQWKPRELWPSLILPLRSSIWANTIERYRLSLFFHAFEDIFKFRISMIYWLIATIFQEIFQITRSQKFPDFSIYQFSYQFNVVMKNKLIVASLSALSW